MLFLLISFYRQVYLIPIYWWKSMFLEVDANNSEIKCFSSRSRLFRLNFSCDRASLVFRINEINITRLFIYCFPLFMHPNFGFEYIDLARFDNFVSSGEISTIEFVQMPDSQSGIRNRKSTCCQFFDQLQCNRTLN